MHQTMFMRSSNRVLLLAISALLFYQCQKEISYSNNSGGGSGLVVDPSPLTANLQGNILDENDQPAAGVTIKVGSETGVTDSKGYFRINNASLDENASLVKAEKAGYFTAFRSFSATSGTNQVVIKLVKRNLGGTINSANGGDVTLSNGTKISLPANGIIKSSDNSNYTGTVNVYASYIDPTAADISSRVPGSFMANDKDGKRVFLNSYGMMAVELESSAGEKLQIKSGNEATLTTTIPSSMQSTAPATIALWYVDEAMGLWKEEGTATKQGNNYVGTVKHFSFWNCDISIPAITLSATLRTAKGQALVNTRVEIKADKYGATSGFTDSLGQVKGLVPANVNLTLSVMDNCGTPIYTKNLGSQGENVDVGVITVNPTGPSIVTVQGKLTNCAGANVTKGYAIVTLDNWVRYAKTDANGNFSTNYTVCNTNLANVQVLGVDETAQQQGASASFAVTAPTTDLGTVSACGTSSAQYINYQIDGTSYTLTEADSLSAFTQTQNATSTTYIDGMQMGSGNYLSFKFSHSANVAGTYPMANMSTKNFATLTVVQPLNIIVTNFPQSVGTFYQGSFTGQFKDGSNVTHNISCTFRVRRSF
jgi:hypothetical protein